MIVCSTIRENDQPVGERSDSRESILDAIESTDCDFGDLENPEQRAEALARIPGARGHGLFVDMVDEVVYGTEDGVGSVQC